MAKLTKKQKRFVEEYLVDLNATQAAIRAGYSEKNAKEIGYENLTKLHIREELENAMKERSERTEITADGVLKELAKVGFADIKNYISWVTAGHQPVIELVPSDEVDGAVVKKVSITKDGVFTFELHDKMTALEKIGKHLGMFKDVKEVTGKDGGPVKFQTWVEMVLGDDDEKDEEDS